ncbi:MAG: transporter, drug/metabolite exporter family, partial [Gammaproteobacteria bacterium]|nr:transporter, drug/metabolite exporter family [Gammaproteobacteria bacterium]
RLLDFICAAFCLLGIYILTGADLHHLVMGDAWTFLAAVCYALAILFIQKYSQELEKEVNLIAFYQIFFTIPLALAMSGKFTWPVLFNPHVIAAILFCALVATCVVFYLQLNYQKHTTATKAALIYALEPVFAVFFAYFIEGEHPVFFTLLGGAIIMGSILLSDFKFSSK